MKEVFDYLASLIIGGAVMVTMVGFQAGIRDVAATQATDVAIQQDFSSLTNVIEYDIRKMGYRVADSVNVLRADSSTFTFKGDVNNDGSVETIMYYLRSSTMSSMPGLKSLYRVVNSQTPMLLEDQISQLRFSYYDGQGNLTANLQKIRSIRVSLILQSDIEVDSTQSGVSWDRIITPLNLR